jgi:hypothetical protein
MSDQHHYLHLLTWFLIGCPMGGILAYLIWSGSDFLLNRKVLMDELHPSLYNINFWVLIITGAVLFGILMVVNQIKQENRAKEKQR